MSRLALLASAIALVWVYRLSRPQTITITQPTGQSADQILEEWARTYRPGRPPLPDWRDRIHDPERPR